MSTTYTPDPLGYLLAVLASVAATACALALITVFSGDWEDTFAVLILGGFYAGILAIPSAAVGVPLVHLACRNVPQQWVHVLAAGIAGVITGLVFGLLTDWGLFEPGVWWFLLVLGGATAIGRASRDPAGPGAVLVRAVTKVIYAMFRDLPLVVVGMAIGLLSLGGLGCVVGLLIGLHVHAETAVFAALEIGLPSATVGAVVGLVVGALAQWVIASHQDEQGPVDDDFAGKPPGW